MIIKPPKNQKILKPEEHHATNPIITCKSVTKVFGEKDSKVMALRGININIYPTEFIIIYGPSGSGKSTLLNIISGLDKPTQGSLIIENLNPYEFNDKENAAFHRRRMGMVFQSYNLIPTITILQNITLPLAFEGVPKAEREKKAEALLERFGMVNLKDRLPSEVSGGQQQRIGIIRSLINNPPIIIADEPTGNLDSVTSQNVMKLFKELNITFDTTIVVVTHDLSQFVWADRVIHVLDGKVVKQTVFSKKSMLVEQTDEYPIVYEGQAKRIIDNLANGDQTIIDKIESKLEEKEKKLEKIEVKVDIKKKKVKTDEEKRKPKKNVFKIVWDRRDKLDNQTQRILSFMQLSLSEDQLQRLDSEELEKTINAIELRLNEDIKKADLIRLLDSPITKGGAGLYKQTAIKIAENLEKVLKLK